MTIIHENPALQPRPSVPKTLPLKETSPRTPLRLSDAVVPLRGHILASESIDNALKQLTTSGGEYLAITDPEEGLRGIMSRSDIEQLQRKYPDYWSMMRCGNVVVASERILNVEDTFDAAVDMLKEEGLRPLLVLQGNTICGVLEPTSVLQWCAEHRPEALQELALQDLG